MQAGDRTFDSAPRTGFAAVGVGVFMIVFCAGGPLIVGLLGGLALGMLGAGAAVIAVVIVAAVIVARGRRRRACGPARH